MATAKKAAKKAAPKKAAKKFRSGGSGTGGRKPAPKR
jgi:hypothetical protein